MAENSLYHYISTAGLSSSLEFSYSFNLPSGAAVPVETGQPAHSGQIFGGISNFWSVGGSGFFSGNSLQVQSSNLIDTSSWTALLIFERQKSGEQILFSSMSNGDPSGILLGITDSSKYFVSAWDEQGFYNTKTFNLPIGKKNGIAVAKNGSSISLFDFNFQEKRSYGETFSFPLTAVIDSDYLFFGGTSGTPANVNSGFFYGYFDEISFFNQTLNDQTINHLFQGYYSSLPTTGYSLISKSEYYNYKDLNVLKNIQFDSLTSGGLDYIRQNIFNKTGIGQIVAVSSGHITGTSGDISGYISGQVYLPTGSYQYVTGSRVTGYLTSGDVVTASGITGYSVVTMHPFGAFSGDIYQVSGLSGISGATAWTPTFTSPLYENYIKSVFVEGRITRDVFNTFNYWQTGLSNEVNFVHTGVYVNNGSDKINVQNTLYYSGSIGEPSPFTVTKFSSLNYGNVRIEGSINQGFLNSFYMDGAISYRPAKTGENIHLNWVNSTGAQKINEELLLDLSSGAFKTENDEVARDVHPFINGILQSTGVYQDISGSFDSNYLSQNLTWDRFDTGVYDSVSGIGVVNHYDLASGFVSGSLIFSGQHGGLVYVNGQSLISGVDFIDDPTSGIILQTDLYSGLSGASILLNTITGTLNSAYTGDASLIKNAFPKKNSMFFKNGVRQILKFDYKEISSFDNLYSFTGQSDIAFEEIIPSISYIVPGTTGIFPPSAFYKL